MSSAARLAELGFALPEVAAPVAAYVPAVIAGDLVYVSGQLPFTDGSLPVIGKVGDGDGFVSPSTAKRLAQRCILNGLAAVNQAIGSLDRIERIVKVSGFVASDPAFTGQPGVINGASEFLVDVFGARGVHARSAVGVAVLPLDSPVEVELIVQFS